MHFFGFSLRDMIWKNVAPGANLEISKNFQRLDAIADLGAIGMQAFDLTLRGHMPQGNIQQFDPGLQVRNRC